MEKVVDEYQSLHNRLNLLLGKSFDLARRSANAIKLDDVNRLISQEPSQWLWIKCFMIFVWYEWVAIWCYHWIFSALALLITIKALCISSKLLLIRLMASVPLRKLWMASPTNLSERSLVLVRSKLVLSSYSMLSQCLCTFLLDLWWFVGNLTLREATSPSIKIKERLNNSEIIR